MVQRAWKFVLVGIAVPSAIFGASLVSCVGDSPDAQGAGVDASTADGTTEARDASTAGDSSSTDTGDADLPNRAIAVKLGSGFGCALMRDKSVSCWGSNGAGVVGRAPGGTLPPTKIAGLDDVLALEAGLHHACVIRSDQTVWCWGKNDYGQLGHNPSTDEICESGSRCNPKPQKVDGVSAVRLSGGRVATCAITTTGGAVCWGYDDYGQLGSGGAPSQVNSSPKQVVSLEKDVLDISVSAWPGYYACAVKQDNRVWCWGGNVDNALGHTAGTRGDIAPCAGGSSCNTSPTKVTMNPDGTGGDLDNVAKVLAGSNTTCVVRLDKSVWCWGANRGGQLGLGDVITRAKPTQVAGLANVTTLVGASTVCALTAAGEVWCWGEASSGSTGSLGVADAGCFAWQGNAASCVLKPLAVTSLRATEIDVGFYESAALTDAGIVTWGGGPALGRDASGADPVPGALQGLP